MNQAQLLQLLKQIADELSQPNIVFPTCFDLTTRVQTLLKDPNLSLDRLADLLSTEPLISARLIGLANSVAIRGAGEPVSDLRSAVMRVGIELVRSTAYAVAMDQLVSARELLPYKEFTQQIWRHSLLVAALARRLARSAGTSGDKAFLAGMVHDIGAHYLLYRCAKNGVLALDQLEFQAILQEWHGGIGHALLTALELPEEITEAVQEHESLRAINTLRRLPEILAVSNMLANKAVDWVPEALRQTRELSLREGLLSDEAADEMLELARQEAGELEAALH